MKPWLIDGLLGLGLLGLIAAPLLAFRDAAFTGADDKLVEVVGTLAPDYEPWFEPLLAPPTNGVETLLFSTQVAIGAGILGFAARRLRRGSRGGRSCG